MNASTQPAKDVAAGAEPMQLVSFSVAAEEYGLDILRVQEIIRTQPLTRVPSLPGYVEGVINLRGKVIPVISLRRRLGLEAAPPGKNTRIAGLTAWFNRSSAAEIPTVELSTGLPFRDSLSPAHHLKSL